MYKSILTWVAIITLILTGMVQTAWAESFSGYLESGACTGEHSFSLGEDSGLRFTATWDSTLKPFLFEIYNSDESLYYGGRSFGKSGDTISPDFPLGPGSYKLYITSCVSWGGHGNYTISYQTITPSFQNDTEPNDDFENSQSVSIPGVIEGHLGYYDNEEAGLGGNPVVSKTDYFDGDIDIDINRKANLYVTFDEDITLSMYSFAINDEVGKYVGGTRVITGHKFGPYPISKAGLYFISCNNNWYRGGYGSYQIKTRIEYEKWILQANSIQTTYTSDDGKVFTTDRLVPGESSRIKIHTQNASNSEDTVEAHLTIGLSVGGGPIKTIDSSTVLLSPEVTYIDTYEIQTPSDVTAVSGQLVIKLHDSTGNLLDIYTQKVRIKNHPKIVDIISLILLYDMVK